MIDRVWANRSDGNGRFNHDGNRRAFVFGRFVITGSAVTDSVPFHAGRAGSTRRSSRRHTEAGKTQPIGLDNRAATHPVKTARNGRA